MSVLSLFRFRAHSAHFGDSRRFFRSVCVMVFVALAATPFAQAQDAPQDGDYVVRINRLEAQIRQLSGQVEELQFANKKLEETLKKFVQDVEMRFQDSKSQDSKSAPASQPSKAAPVEQGSQPLNLSSTAKNAPAQPATNGTLAAQAQNAKNTPAQPAKPADAKTTLSDARSALASGDYEQASTLARSLVQSFPKDPLVPDALILSGDADYRLKRYPEAAQNYLNVAKTYASSKQAPLAFAKLGDALVSMGQKAQACATFGEFGKRFPDADAALKARVEKAQKGAGC